MEQKEIIENLPTIQERLSSARDEIQNTPVTICKECGNKPATKDYNGHQYFVCDLCYVSLNNYFDEEYR